MSFLVRMKAGCFTKNSLTLERIKEMVENDTIEKALQVMKRFLRILKGYVLIKRKKRSF